jgi:hypothetical protein
MDESHDKYEALLAAHLEVNPRSWAALQERGVDEATGARALMRFLGTSTDYEYKGGARNQEDGTQRWMVLGQTSPMTLSLVVLDEWVALMTSYGRDHGDAVFDGWGARVPEGAAALRKRRRGEQLRRLGRRGR